MQAYIRAYFPSSKKVHFPSFVHYAKARPYEATMSSTLMTLHMIQDTGHMVGDEHWTLYHGLDIYREVTFVNVTSVAENTKFCWPLVQCYSVFSAPPSLGYGTLIHSLKMSAPQLFWFGIDSVWKILNERITERMNEWINKEQIVDCRTAPATLGLLKTRRGRPRW